HTSDWATCDVASHIAAGANRIQADAPQFFEHFGEGLDRDPVQLDILAHGQIGGATGIAAGEIGDGAELIGAQKAVGNSNAEHEERQGTPYAALATHDAGAVALRVNSPPAEVGSDHSAGIESKPSRAKRRISARPSHGFMARLR